MISVSIVIVTHNSDWNIGPCLDSIFDQDFKDFELTVVDNASVDTTKIIINNKFPHVRIIENSENRGSCIAWNQGIAHTSGKYVLCLNDDVTLRSDFLSKMYYCMEDKVTLGALQPKMLSPVTGKIDSVGIHLTVFRKFCDVGSGKDDGEEFNKEQYIFGACGAAVFYRREALDSIKQRNEYFDEDFFCLVEDVDVSWRMQNKGWSTLYYPSAVGTHIRGMSRRRDSFSQFLCMRNRYLMIIKNESLRGIPGLIAAFIIYDSWRNLYMFAVNPRYFFKAAGELIRLFPKMIRKRRGK